MKSLCAGLRADPGIKTKDEWWQLPAPLDITLVYVPYDQRGAKKKKGATYYSNIIYFPEIGLAWVLQSSSAPRSSNSSPQTQYRKKTRKSAVQASTVLSWIFLHPPSSLRSFFYCIRSHFLMQFMTFDTPSSYRWHEPESLVSHPDWSSAELRLARHIVL